MTANKTKWVRLGDYIEQRREKNSVEGLPIRGVSREGFIPPKQLDANTSIYNVFYKGDFIFNPARMELNSIALNTEFDMAICSSLYEVFYITRPSELLPEYLNLYLKRDEFARYCAYDAIGSARNYFRVANMKDIRIPLPSMEVQRELVATYEGLKRLAEDNEALIAPLTEACQAFIVDCKRQYPSVPLGDYIEEVDERNTEGKYSVEDVRGMTITKEIIPTKADLKHSNLSNFKVVRPQEFIYNPRTHGKKIGLGFNLTSNPFIISWNNIAFRVINTNTLVPEYLFMLFCRSEWDRNACFRSWGSSTEVFSWSALCETIIPLPPLEVQQSIVNLYHCIEEAKSIAREARERLTTLCPALVQYAINA
ncbi:restriction endonuclease subunit S [uncultured Porphyromonas sp.]|uniref:restriction endonuclease subunit S n=1 Tax=uncultured Porphyromonas sp. TaxID=159274 RepID=UPI00262D53B4|nr:restriction endonuclease subunit S [uncultured Porphyromonas sp.]